MPPIKIRFFSQEPTLFVQYKSVKARTAGLEKISGTAIRAVNVVQHRVISDFKRNIRVITDFTPRYNRFFALYPIYFTVGISGPS